MLEEEVLAFVDVAPNKTLDGKFLYKAYFTTDSSVVWGNDWNVVPCSIIPNITPDKTTVYSITEFKSNVKYNLAKVNSCFSMQDCIDGIIALLFSEPRSKQPIILKFGDSKEDVYERLKGVGAVICNEHLIDKTTEIIDETMKKLEKLQNEEGTDDGFEEF